jgi:hypothetical protein
MTFGGVYEFLAQDTGCLPTKVGGKLALDIGEPIPTCRQCGKEMHYALQFLWPEENPEAYRGAVVFVCTNRQDDCEPSEWQFGANAVVLLKVLKTVTPHGGELSHAFKVKWIQRKEVSEDPWAVDLLDSDLIEAEKDRDKFIEEYGYTKMGGNPLWLGSPERPRCKACEGPTVFAAQFSASLGCGKFGEKYAMPFGEEGVGYLFLCARRCSSRAGAFLWHCR